MGQYHKVVNIDAKEFVNPYEVGLLGKHHEQIGFTGSMSDIIYLLLIAQGDMPRGSGDASTPRRDSIIGRWCGDRVVVVGDYYTDPEDDPLYKDLYNVDEDKEYTNVSEEVRHMLKGVFRGRVKFDV